MPYSIFDLDNCLSDDEWRLNLIDFTKENLDERYEEYHKCCGRDKTNERTLNVLFRTFQTCTPVFFTARPAEYREVTSDWIKHNLHIEHPILYMREWNDHRHGAVLKEGMLKKFTANFVPDNHAISLAFDDRLDIVEMYRSNGIEARQLKIHDRCALTPPIPSPPPSPKLTAADILGEMADTYRERNKVYGDNFRIVGKVLADLHPDGATQLSASDHELYHLWSLLVVKLSRFAVGGLTHLDSIHDLSVYAAMIEALLRERGAK